MKNYYRLLTNSVDQNKQKLQHQLAHFKVQEMCQTNKPIIYEFKWVSKTVVQPSFQNLFQQSEFHLKHIS